MWRCSQCGEAIADNFDACWRCGMNCDGTASEDFRAEPNDASVPDPDSEAKESDQTVGEIKPSGPPEQALTRENLAVLLLRFLGVCFTALGIIGVSEQVIYILALSRESSLDEALGYYRWEYLAHSAAQLIVGMYFLVGGQWVFDKVLTPIDRVCSEDARPGTEKEDSEDHRVGDRNGATGTKQPQDPPSD